MRLFSAIERQQMISAVLESINHGLNYGTRAKLDNSGLNDGLLHPAATFVTLTMDGLLRGSMGSIIATEPLVDNIQYNAYSAAFEDPRFLPLNRDELPLIDIDISILSETEKLSCQSEEELLQQLQPGADGLILTEGDKTVTFLPTVWEQLIDVDTFVRELKKTAGLEPCYWSDTLIAERFSVTSYKKSH